MLKEDVHREVIEDSSVNKGIDSDVDKPSNRPSNFSLVMWLVSSVG